MVNSIEVILVPTFMIIVGVLLKYFNILDDDHSSLLSKIVLNISLPALIFINISSSRIEGQMILLPLISFGLSFICMLIAYFYSKLRGYSKIKTWTLIILLSMMNTAFIGYPIVLGVFGNEGLTYAIFYDMAVAILFVIFGIILSTIFGGNKKEVIHNGLTFVPLWAIIFGLIFNIFNIPLGYVLKNSLTYLGNSAIPLIMLSLGLTISFKDFKSYLSDVVFVSFSRLLIAPIILYTLLAGTGFSGLMLQVSVLQSAMPTAMNSLVLAITYDLDVELVSAVVFITTIISLLTLPVIISVL
ncbi:AEC family transporter [Methanosphaera sp. ISO3-F5]|uniref:AEC family transporter n=1 Tax=Methanosphaera sp. ISO3-F5 TaxID=1452353 RepID=UPI002B263691|nr:AEC family transporter [Methanosphaera sp. ISO3-F5]